MEVKIKFRDSDARVIHGFLRHRYRSKAALEKLAKRAIWEVVSQQADTEINEAKHKAQESRKEID